MTRKKRTNAETEENYRLARLILGDDFILFKEIAVRCNLFYNKKTIEYFMETIPEEEMLCWIKDHGFVLIAGAPKKMSLLEIYDFNSQLFCFENERLCKDGIYCFPRNERVSANWLAIKRNLILDSEEKPLEKQKKLLSKRERIPNVSEVVWSEVVYKKVRGIWLSPPDVTTRTSSFEKDFSSYLSSSDNVGVKIIGKEDVVGVYLYSDTGYEGFGIKSALITPI